MTSSCSGDSERVLVTGAGGFIGHHLVAGLLDAGYEVAAFLRYTSTGSHGLLDHLRADHRSAYVPVLGDLRDFETVRRAMQDCSAVLHLGALIGIPYSYVSPADVVSVNIGGTMNVLQAARLHENLRRVIVTSTSEVYGTAQQVPIAESHQLSAQSPYAASKTGADQLALSYHRSFDLPVSICRPFNTFGPGQSPRAIVPTVISQALFRDEIRIGSLFPTRDLSYVSNIVDGFVAMLRSDDVDGRVIQFGSGSEISIEQLIGKVLRIIGRDDLPVISEKERVRPTGSEVERLVAATDQARELLGWSPAIDLEEGLRLTIDWIGDNPELYRDRAESYTI